MENGKRKMENGKWKMRFFHWFGFGKWRMDNEMKELKMKHQNLEKKKDISESNSSKLKRKQIVVLEKLLRYLKEDVEVQETDDVVVVDDDVDNEQEMLSRESVVEGRSQKNAKRKTAQDRHKNVEPKRRRTKDKATGGRNYQPKKGTYYKPFVWEGYIKGFHESVGNEEEKCTADGFIKYFNENRKEEKGKQRMYNEDTLKKIYNKRKRSQS